MYHSRFISLLILLFLTISLDAQEEYFKHQFLFTIENDFLGVDNKDDNYTGGLNLDIVIPEFNFKQPFYKFPKGRHFQIISIGGTGYTPQDLTSTDIVIGDRPYASLTYLSFGKLSVSKNFKKQLNSQFIIGLTGWQGPGEVQYYLHDNNAFGSTRPNPQGWKNQIGYNGSFILNYNFQWIENFNQKENEGEEGETKKVEFLQPSWILGGKLGNYMINVETGIYLNIINVNSFPVFGANGIKIPTLLSYKNSDSSYKEKKKSKFIRLHLFAEPKIRIVVYDVTLQGLLFGDDSPYVINSKDVNRLVLDIKSGIKILFFDKFFLGFNHYIRSREFKQGKTVHNWGGITFGYSSLTKNF